MSPQACCYAAQLAALRAVYAPGADRRREAPTVALSAEDEEFLRSIGVAPE